MRVRVKNKIIGLAAVSLRTTLKYRRNWNKNSPAVRALQKMMPTGSSKKSYRLYIPMNERVKHHFVIPPAVRSALKKMGYVATDYLAKKCVKIADKEQKNVFNIGKVIAKDEHAKAAFDNDPQLQNSHGGKGLQMVISCHPYDIIGMSTGRDWDNQSCMRLKDNRVGFDNGQYSHHVKADVAEGTLVAYAVDTADTNINRPKGRCLIKPFINNEGDVLYRRETKIYGNPVPGFNSTLNAFIRKLNADAKSGTYEMPENLYNDGISQEHTHQGTGDGIHLDDAIEDPNQAIPYVKQQMAIIREGEHAEKVNVGDISGARKNANDIAKLLNDAEGLITPQLDEIADLVRGSDFVAQYVTDETLRDAQISPALAYVARKADLVAKRKSIKLPENVDVKLARKLARTANPTALSSVLSELNDESNDEGHHAQIVADFLRGVVPIPPKEELDKYPHAKSLLRTVASASRFMAIFNHTRYQEAAYEILDNTEDSDKVLNEEVLNVVKEIHGPEFVLSYLLDNVGRLSADDWFFLDTRVMAEALSNRRAFRAFDRLTDGQAVMFMEHVKIDQLRTIVTYKHRANSFKGNFDSILKFFTENPENVDSVMSGMGVNQSWDLNNVKNLAEFSLPLFMQLSGTGPAFSADGALSALLNAISPLILAHTGEKLEPASTELVFLMQVLQVAGSLLDAPVDFTKFVEFDPEPLDDVRASYRSRTARERDADYKTFTRLLTSLEIDGKSVPITREMDLVISEAPYSFSFLPHEMVLANTRVVLKSVAKIQSMDTLLKSLEQMVDNSVVVEPEDEDDAINKKMESFEADYEDEDYDELYSEAYERAQEEVYRENDKVHKNNSDIVRFLSEICSFVGEPEDADDDDEDEEKDLEFGYSTPQFTPEIFEEFASDIEELRQAAKDAYERAVEEAEEYSDSNRY